MLKNIVVKWIEDFFQKITTDVLPCILIRHVFEVDDYDQKFMH